MEPTAPVTEDSTLTSVLRPAAVLPESAARKLLVELAHHDVRDSGCWASGPHLWQRYDRPWSSPGHPGDAELLGTLSISYGAPTRYAITIYRGSVTPLAHQHGWTVAALCDEALAFGDYTLASCPRVDLAPSRALRLTA